MSEQDDASALAVGVGKSGAQLKASHRFLEWLCPKRSARAKIILGLAEGLSKRLASGETLTGAETVILSALLPAEFSRLHPVIAIADSARLQSPAVEASLMKLPNRRPSAETSRSWRDRFWCDAEDVTDEYMQALYGRILAGERSRPGSFSLLTIRVLRYLEADAAAALAKLLTLTVSERYILTGEEEFLGAAGLTFDDFTMLEEAGLVGGKAALSIRAKEDGFAYLLARGVCFKGHPKRDMIHDGHLMTRAGEELSSLVPAETGMSQIHAIASKLKLSLSSIQWARVSHDLNASIDDLRWTSVD